jgi:hypothetical protein
MNKAELRKHADALADGAMDCIRSVLVKHNMGIIEGAAESVATARTEALDEVLAMLDELHIKAQKPTPLEKGMRMAIGSAMDRVLAMKTPNGEAKGRA